MTKELRGLLQQCAQELGKAENEVSLLDFEAWVQNRGFELD